MYKVLLLICIVAFHSSCGTTRYTAYPDNWPSPAETFNISGTYKNSTAVSSHPDEFGTLFSRLSWIHFFGYSDRSETTVSEGMKKEFDSKDNTVDIVQDEDTISVSLYRGSTKVKEYLFRDYRKEKNAVLMTAVTTIYGEILYLNEFYFSNAQNGSLILEEKISTTYGWFIESTNRSNSWHQWERVKE